MTNNNKINISSPRLNKHSLQLIQSLADSLELSPAMVLNALVSFSHGWFNRRLICRKCSHKLCDTCLLRHPKSSYASLLPVIYQDKHIPGH